MTATGGFFRFRQHNQGFSLNEDVASQVLGLTGVGPDAFPRFNIGGNPGFTSFGTGNQNRLFAFTNFEYTAHFTKVQGSHTFKFGWDFRRYQGSELGHQRASGQFDCANTDTRELNADGGVISGTGRDLASFLLGQADRAPRPSQP